MLKQNPSKRNHVQNIHDFFLRDFALTGLGKALIIYFAFIKYWRKNGNTMKQCISSL